MIHNLLTLSSPPFQYLDPGTGSFVIQAAIAFFLGAWVMVGIYWKRIRTFFSRKKDTQPAPAPEEPRKDQEP